MKPEQTAVEWLMINLPSLFVDDSGHYKQLFEQAKAMEREQIINAFGVGCQVESKRLIGYQAMANEYYQETYVK